MDKKYTKRFESFKKSLDSLAEAKERDMSDSFVLSGTSAKFSITFDLAWKVMKDILVQHYEIVDFVSGSPKEVLKASFHNFIYNFIYRHTHTTILLVLYKVYATFPTFFNNFIKDCTNDFHSFI